MIHENAMKHFSFDPFAVRSRESCTVGALRAEAKSIGVDTTPVPNKGGLKPSFKEGKVVTCGEVNRQLEKAMSA